MAASDPITTEPRRFSIRPPRPLWIGVAVGVVMVGAVGMRIGIPVYRQQATIREIERVVGHGRKTASAGTKFTIPLLSPFPAIESELLGRSFQLEVCPAEIDESQSSDD